MMWPRGPGSTGAGRILENAGNTISMRWNAANLRIFCGAIWNLGFVTERPMHVILTRDGSNNGHIYRDSIPVGTAAIGSNDLANEPLYIGNDNVLGQPFDGWIYGIRIYDDLISSDEAALLFEYSRLKLWPGSPKRAGIMSRW
jgi:hypothetical protein